MVDCKPCSTPCKPHNQVLTNDGVLLSDHSFYKSLVGALQYLIFTRLDIAFAVNTVCQYMKAPPDIYLEMVKRILRFLQGTSTCGLTYTSASSIQL